MHVNDMPFGVVDEVQKSKARRAKLQAAQTSEAPCANSQTTNPQWDKPQAAQNSQAPRTESQTTNSQRSTPQQPLAHQFQSTNQRIHRPALPRINDSDDESFSHPQLQQTRVSVDDNGLNAEEDLNCDTQGQHDDLHASAPLAPDSLPRNQTSVSVV